MVNLLNKVWAIMKKLFILLFLVNGLVLLESCCGFGENWPEHFDWEDIHLNTSDKKHNRVVSLNQKIAFDSVSFNFSIDQILLASRPSASSSLLACEPPLPMSIRSIDEIQIMSSNDFITASKTYTANSDLTELFFVYDFSPVSVLISNSNFSNYFAFRLNIRPKGEQQHEFKFSFKLDDGRVFEESTNLLLIH